MNDLTIYHSLRSRIRPGDIIAFSGNKLISWLIEFFSGSNITHVGIVRQNKDNDVILSESNITHDHNGVQDTPLGPMLAEYGDGAKAWWLPLDDEIRKSIDWFKFYKIIGASTDFVKYDKQGLVEFLVRMVPGLGPHLGQTEHPDKMFCDGWVIAVLEACGVLRGVNYSKMTPQDLVEMKLFKPAVQLIGSPGKIKRYNSV